MKNNQHYYQVVEKEVSGKQAVIACQHPTAADVGLEMLKKGGNAMDAAIAASMVLNIVEPWSSGLGGGGFLLNYSAESKQIKCLNFHMKTPRSIDQSMFKPEDGKYTQDLFATLKSKTI